MCGVSRILIRPSREDSPPPSPPADFISESEPGGASPLATVLQREAWPLGTALLGPCAPLGPPGLSAPLSRACRAHGSPCFSAHGPITALSREPSGNSSDINQELRFHPVESGANVNVLFLCPRAQSKSLPLFQRITCFW